MRQRNNADIIGRFLHRARQVMALWNERLDPETGRIEGGLFDSFLLPKRKLGLEVKKIYVRGTDTLVVHLSDNTQLTLTIRETRP